MGGGAQKAKEPLQRFAVVYWIERLSKTKDMTYMGTEGFPVYIRTVGPIGTVVIHPRYVKDFCKRLRSWADRLEVFAEGLEK
jgi:hypothetical protein